jgi:hypothetical protein
MELMHIRATERLLVVGTGALSIWLGYLLFRAVRATGESDAHIKLPGDVTVMLTRVGPGVFFALFGTQGGMRVTNLNPFAALNSVPAG